MGAALELSEAQDRLLALAAPLAIERVDVAGSLGRYLAEPLQARRRQPAADLSAMDGYAVSHADLSGPWQVSGESAAGHPYTGEIAPGQAVRIATGALVPPGTQAVILQEDCSREGNCLTLTGTPPSPPDRHIRRSGLDFTPGTPLLPQGSRIGPAQIGLAIAAGHKHLAVHREARLAIIDSGDELSSDPEACALHQIPASNGAMLHALARSLPCAVERIGPVPDDVTAFTAALDRCAASDVIVTIGGASVGDHDVVRPALEQWGAKLDFWRVAMKPGKPLLVARRGHQIVIGLPGNPVSSFVTGFLFMLPLLRALLGSSAPLPSPFSVAAAEPLPAGGPRREFLRGRCDGREVRQQGIQDSSVMASLAASNVLIDRPAGCPAVEPGEPVPVYWLENGGVA